MTQPTKFSSRFSFRFDRAPRLEGEDFGSQIIKLFADSVTVQAQDGLFTANENGTQSVATQLSLDPDIVYVANIPNEADSRLDPIWVKTTLNNGNYHLGKCFSLSPSWATNSMTVLSAPDVIETYNSANVLQSTLKITDVPLDSMGNLDFTNQTVPLASYNTSLTFTEHNWRIWDDAEIERMPTLHFGADTLDDLSPVRSAESDIPLLYRNLEPTLKRGERIGWLVRGHNTRTHMIQGIIESADNSEMELLGGDKLYRQSVRVLDNLELLRRIPLITNESSFKGVLLDCKKIAADFLINILVEWEDDGEMEFFNSPDVSIGDFLENVTSRNSPPPARIVVEGDGDILVTNLPYPTDALVKQPQKVIDHDENNRTTPLAISYEYFELGMPQEHTLFTVQFPEKVPNKSLDATGWENTYDAGIDPRTYYIDLDGGNYNIAPKSEWRVDPVAGSNHDGDKWLALGGKWYYIGSLDMPDSSFAIPLEENRVIGKGRHNNVEYYPNTPWLSFYDFDIVVSENRRRITYTIDPKNPHYTGSFRFIKGQLGAKLRGGIPITEVTPDGQASLRFKIWITSYEVKTEVYPPRVEPELATKLDNFQGTSRARSRSVARALLERESGGLDRVHLTGLTTTEMSKIKEHGLYQYVDGGKTISKRIVAGDIGEYFLARFQANLVLRDV